MQMVRHKVFGLGEVLSKEKVGEFTYLKVRYENGQVMQLGIPFSFENGAVEALGTLQDEVNQVIAERTARLATATAPAAPTKKVAGKTMPTGPVASDFENYLINAGYKEETDDGVPSTVYSYLNAVESVRTEEGISWDTLKNNISSIVPKYDEGGAKELIGAKSNRTVINALKRFAEFAGKP